MRSAVLALLLAAVPLACDSYTAPASQSLEAAPSLQSVPGPRAPGPRAPGQRAAVPSQADVDNDVWLDLASGAENDFQFRMTPLQEGDRLRASLLTADGHEAVALIHQKAGGVYSLSVVSPQTAAIWVEARMDDKVVASFAGSFQAGVPLSIGSTDDPATSIHERCAIYPGGKERCYFYYDITGTPTGSTMVDLVSEKGPVEASEVGVVIERDANKQPLNPSHVRLSMSEGMEVVLSL